jgi:hypothetical protein
MGAGMYKGKKISLKERQTIKKVERPDQVNSIMEL